MRGCRGNCERRVCCRRRPLVTHPPGNRTADLICKPVELSQRAEFLGGERRWDVKRRMPTSCRAGLVASDCVLFRGVSVKE